jgi:hypothetical protein
LCGIGAATIQASRSLQPQRAQLCKVIYVCFLYIRTYQSPYSKQPAEHAGLPGLLPPLLALRPITSTAAGSPPAHARGTCEAATTPLPYRVRQKPPSCMLLHGFPSPGPLVSHSREKGIVCFSAGCRLPPSHARTSTPPFFRRFSLPSVRCTEHAGPAPPTAPIGCPCVTRAWTKPEPAPHAANHGRAP